MAASPQTLLLVDGYNIIGAWSCLQQTRDQHGLEVARQELVDKLINYAAHQGYKTQIVFDAYYQKTPSSQEDYGSHLSVYFTAFAQTADTYIEKVCADYSRKLKPQPTRLIVATSDNAQRLTVQGYGADWFCARRLEQEIEIAQKSIRRLPKNHKQSPKRFLGDALDAKVQEQLSQWLRGNY
jgi:predicted RNA-binding protein with PIN domain